MVAVVLAADAVLVVAVAARDSKIKVAVANEKLAGTSASLTSTTTTSRPLLLLATATAIRQLLFAITIATTTARFFMNLDVMTFLPSGQEIIRCNFTPLAADLAASLGQRLVDRGTVKSRPEQASWIGIVVRIYGRK